MIYVNDVSKEYRTASGIIRALDGISLGIAPGMRVGVFGRNGAGKSTLIRLVGGIEKPTAGNVSRTMSVSWPLAYKGGFHPRLSGYSNIRFISRIYDRPFEPMLQYVEEFTELGDRLKDPVDTYSAGMRAKLSFGVSLSIEFDCYLVDEITGVGDADFRKKCRTELFEKRADRALLMVSHQTATIQQSCHVGILIDEGRYIDTFDITANKRWYKYAKPEW